MPSSGGGSRDSVQQRGQGGGGGHRSKLSKRMATHGPEQNKPIFSHVPKSYSAVEFVICVDGASRRLNLLSRATKGFWGHTTDTSCFSLFFVFFVSLLSVFPRRGMGRRLLEVPCSSWGP